MSDTRLSRSGQVAILRLSRGKVNALNEPMVEELARRLEEVRGREELAALVLTGDGSFFSFGFDIPEFLSYPREAFVRYLGTFTDLYTDLFVFPKPVVAALNGHTIAGGCMLALACDSRIMAAGRGKIALNEVTFGSSVFAGSAEMLEACVGFRNAERVLSAGAMYSAGEAESLGLVDQVVEPERLLEVAVEKAAELGGGGRAFGSLKALLRKPVAARMRRREPASIEEFADIWYSEETWQRLRQIEIR